MQEPATLDEERGERYRTLAVLGQGGMGEVLLSRDGRIGREVAMKIVRGRAGAAREHQARFLREARVQGQLEHPAVVPVYDLGRDADGTPYFTMKRVNGKTLEEALEALAAHDPEAEARFGRRKLLAAFVQVCLAVDYAHARGVLHRDLKPANIMLGDFGEVYLLDWGLARLSRDDDGPPADDALATGSTLPDGALPAGTEAGSILGTPGTMSPEQVRGLALDARSDVYSLGAMLFEILTLEPLHRGQTVTQILAETLAGVDARARERAPQRDIAPELEAVCVRATALEPERRFASARELCAAVERYLDGDRDLALRRDLADGHARAAHQAAERAFAADDLDARKQALREVGRALALDPDHAGALRELSQLIARPPRAMPEGAAQEIHAFEREGQRRAALVGFFCYASYFLYLPIGVWMGARQLWAYFVPSPLFLASALLSLRVAYRPHPEGKMPYPLILMSSLAVASMTLIFGPLILVPSVAAVNTIAFMMSRDRTRRPFVIACGVFSLLLPLALESAGVLPPSYAFRDDTMVVLANAVHFPPAPTRALLLIASLGVLLISALLIAKMRDLLTAKEQQSTTHTWQLRQLVPEDATAPRRAAPADAGGCVLLPPRETA